MNNVVVLAENEVSSGVAVFDNLLAGLDVPVVPEKKVSTRVPVLIRFGEASIPRSDSVHDADKYIRGFTVLPDFTEQGKGHQAHRWTFVPPMIARKPFTGADGTLYPAGGILREPAIRASSQVICICTSCRTEKHIFHDVFRDKIMRGRNGISAEGFVFRCPACLKNTMVGTLGESTLTRRTELRHDPVVRSQEDKVGTTDRLSDLFNTGDTENVVALPRIWGLYDKGNCPDMEWRPEDAIDEAAQHSAATYKDIEAGVRPLEILPYRRVRAYHNPERPVSDKLVKLWIDTRDVLGYVKRESLLNSKENMRRIGWERELIPTPRESGASRRKDAPDARLSHV